MKRLFAIFCLCALLTGCKREDITPSTATLPPDQTQAPVVQGRAVYDLDSVKEGMELGVFTITQVERSEKEITFVKAEGTLTVEGIYTRCDMLESFSSEAYDAGTESERFALFRIEKSGAAPLPKVAGLFAPDELTLVVKAENGIMQFGYGRAEIEIKNVIYIKSASPYPYYSYDAVVICDKSL